MDSKIRYWLDLSEYDLETASAMLTSGRYLYVGFMCHQSIEKVFKACYIKFQTESPPFTHSLTLLADKGKFYHLLSEEQQLFLDLLEPLNIEARYPSHKERLMKSLTETKCLEIIQKTKDLQQWISQML